VYANWMVWAAQHLVSKYGVQIAAIIPETTKRWDAEEASRRAELARRGEVYRSSGSAAPVVGALAGLILYTVASLPLRQGANRVLAKVSTVAYGYRTSAPISSLHGGEPAAGLRSCRRADCRFRHQDAARGGAGIGAAAGRRPVLGQIGRGLPKPAADVLNQIAKASAESAGAISEAGILRAHRNQRDARQIITDTTITKRRKQVLLDIYSSLRQQNETARKKPATA
jgi:hypothetical protein